MNLNQLSNQIETNIVNDENGWGQDIQYIQKNNPTPIDTRAMVSDGEFQRKTKGEKPVYEDSISFLSVVLPSKPEAGEKIVHDGDSWIVKSYYGQNPYDIVCVGKQKHVASRSARRKS